ncbi:aromatic-amino-acid transaminase [Cohaesibacter marisflavi]|uniref:Aromatic-amino-acid transaminase n=1 Tax=Cohaesibacter marisflavi TaxID=655353 RepID=A0A1I4ZEB5_9HYPH|nr:amino acid aminotransferase [Cohaesibacter marisflavi]SFN48537.1 aromatic-amino-acid transaminase [Cohaesibacter marisflavi]
MFEKMQEQPPVSLLGLLIAYQADPRPHKIDLGVGVYRDATGHTPVMRAVKAAEKRLWETQDSKRYLGREGDMGFVEALKPIIFGAGSDLIDQTAGLQTPGGCGAIRLAADVIATASPDVRVWTGTPGWPNHNLFFSHSGQEVVEYPFFDLATQTILFDKVREALTSTREGDVFLLHGCCHNPTGANFTTEQWQEIAQLLAERKLVPFLDLAYQGLGSGLEEDAKALQLVLSAVDEAFISYSCDKNFGLYRDRVGALYMMSRNPRELKIAASNASACAAPGWGMPPDHGGAVVRTILESKELTAIWRAELKEMGERVNGNRAALANAHPDLAFIKEQGGLFSTLNMSAETAKKLREHYAIYFADSGRMNLAGMQPADVKPIIDALVAEGVLKAL